VHLGSGSYLSRYKVYLTHVRQWRQQFDKLESVDLRYDGQIIVNPDLEGISRQPVLTPTAAKAAMAAGVKTAAIVNYEKYVTHPAAPVPAKKDAKPRAKAATKDVAHHVRPKQATVRPIPAKQTSAKQAPVKQAASKQALKPSGNAAPVEAAKNTVASHPVAPPSATVVTGQKKPSAGIPKETPQN